MQASSENPASWEVARILLGEKEPPSLNRRISFQTHNIQVIHNPSTPKNPEGFLKNDYSQTYSFEIEFLSDIITASMPKRTYKPSKQSRRKTFGYRARTKTKDGRKILKRRRQKRRLTLIP